MNLTCDMTMDLVSVYKDGLASNDTKKAVEEHLKNCPECRKFYRLYDSVDSKKPDSSSDVLEMDSYSDYNYSQLSKRLRKTHNRNIMIMVGIATAAAALTAVNILKFMRGNNNNANQ